MKDLLKEMENSIHQDHRRKRRTAAVFAVLALLVTGTVNWNLHQTGISKTAEPECGMQEHTHSEECYSSVLVCEQEEHVHSEECYDEEENLICEKEEHTHAEDCYTEELTCTEEEHTHSIECYSDASADVESEEDWEASLPSLTGNWAEDLISVAKSQLGYAESTQNWDTAGITEDEDGEAGYSRYGAWYGSEYGDWDSMFTSFCLHYAGIPESAVPEAAGEQAWVLALNEYGLYQDSSYVPAKGDIVFFDCNTDGTADHTGIITSVSYDENNNAVSFMTIEGDVKDIVAEQTYSIGDAKIAGYLQLPANPDYVEPEETAETAEETTAPETEEAVPEETAAAETEETEAATEEKTEPAVEVTLAEQKLKASIFTDSYYTELSDDQTVITVSGNLPEGGYAYAYPAYVDKSDFEEGITVLRAYDITIFDSEGNKFEPDADHPISVNIEIPGLENMADPDTVSVYYVPLEGDPEEMESETAEEAVSFEAEHFSTYAVTADTTNNTIVINGVTYKPLPNYTEKITTGNDDKVVMLNKDFTYELEKFTLDNTATDDHYYVQLPANVVLKEVDNEPIKDASGNILAYYTVNNAIDADGNTTSYILITPAEASTQITGSLSVSATATKEGVITFNQGGYIYVIPPEVNYNSLTTSKTDVGHTRNADGSYTINFKITIQNTGDTDIEDLWFMDHARLNLGSASLTYTVPVSTDEGAPQFQTRADSEYTGDLGDDSGYDSYFLGTPDKPVTIPANTTYTYTCSATCTAEEFAEIEAAEKQVGTSNSLRVYYKDTQLRENYAWVNYYPASIILSKKALTASVTDDSTIIPWQISYNENSRFNTSNAVITDTIQENAYASGDGIHYLTDYPVTATIMRYGNSQSTIQLTWVEVDNLDNIENPDAEHIYYCGNSFKYFPSTYSGWSSNYGVVLQYYTNYDKELSPTANEAQANFVDIKGVIGEAGETIGVDTKGTFDSRLQLNKMLNAQNDDNTAEWTVVSSVNSTSTLTGNFYDQLPCNNDSNGAKLVASTEKLVNDQKIYANSQVSSDSAYIIFASVAQFEEVTGIKITVTDRVTGAVLDKEAILCGGEVAYTDRWGHTSAASDPKVLMFFYDTKSDKQRNTATFMIVPNIPLSVAETNLSELKYAVNRMDGSGYLPSNEEAGTTAGYNITFTYTTDTSNAEEGETRRNFMTHSGNVVETGDNFNLKADAYYVKTSDDTVKNIDKELAKVTLQEDGSYRLTYVTLLDNRNLKTTSGSFNTIYWDDVLSGVEGAEYVQGSLDVYTANVYLNDDKTSYLLDTYSSLNELEEAFENNKLFKIIEDGQYFTYSLESAVNNEKLINFIKDHQAYVNTHSSQAVSGIGFGYDGLFDMTDLLTVSENSDGFCFTMNTNKAKSSYNGDPQLDLMRYYKSNAVNCWQSFYLVYDVVVPKDQINANVLRNTVTRYLDGNPDVSSYNEFSMIMKELQKKETQHADSSNDYITKYELDVNVDEKLQVLDDFTVQDVMSDNLNMDVTSLVVTSTNSDGTPTTLTGSDYTARFANGSLTLIFSKPTDGWPSSYKITYSAKVTGDGPTTYENSAWIPEIGSTRQTIESSTYITEDEIGDKQVSITIQKYDGNNLSGNGLSGAKFKLERLTNEAQQELLKQNITSRDAMDDYLSSLPDTSWTSTNVPQPQETDTVGKFTLTSSVESAVYSNVVYRLKETSPPTGYVAEDVHRYFMIYSATADETQTGITAAQAYAYVYPYVDQKSFVFSYQIPNYKSNFSVYKTDRKGKDLTGAEFTLYSDENCQTKLQVAIPTLDDDDRICYNFKDLGAGTYYVKETKAPNGYYLCEEVAKVTVNDDGSITYADTITKESDSGFSLETAGIYLSNDSKLIYVDELITYELPASGGSGTQMYTYGGLLLMAISLMYGYGKRRKRRERRES